MVNVLYCTLASWYDFIIVYTYHMNRGYYGVYNKHTTLVLSHRKFTIDKPLGLSMVNFL